MYPHRWDHALDIQNKFSEFFSQYDVLVNPEDVLLDVDQMQPLQTYHTLTQNSLRPNLHYLFGQNAIQWM